MGNQYVIENNLIFKQKMVFVYKKLHKFKTLQETIKNI